MTSLRFPQHMPKGVIFISFLMATSGVQREAPIFWHLLFPAADAHVAFWMPRPARARTAQFHDARHARRMSTPALSARTALS